MSRWEEKRGNGRGFSSRRNRGRGTRYPQHRSYDGYHRNESDSYHKRRGNDGNNSWITTSNTNDNDLNCNQNETKQSQTSQNNSSSRYIPPHLRQKAVYHNHKHKIFHWYKNEQEFESILGTSLHSFKLNISSFIDENKLEQLTHSNTAKCNQSDATVIFVFGPPAAGKSHVYKYYLTQFGLHHEQDVVNSDGDNVRKAHYGINEYLRKTNQLHIGFEGFFKYYVQKWSEKWKINLRFKAMKQKQNIVAFTTCHKSQNVLQEIEMFIDNGYRIKILIVSAEYDICKEMGVKRERLNGRKHLNGAYCKSMRGIMEVVDSLAKHKHIDLRNDLLVVRNKFTPNQRPQILDDEWINIKNKALIPMRKSAIHKLYQTYNNANVVPT